MTDRVRVDERMGRSLLAHLLPSRQWPLMLFTFGAPVAVGLAIHAQIQLDRWMAFWSVLLGGAALGVGSLPAVLASGADTSGYTITQKAGGDRRYFGVFLALGVLSVLAWKLVPARLFFGVPGALAGLAYLVSLGRSGTSLGPAPRAWSNHVVPWCYAVGPAGAVALAALAMRPSHLGAWRDIVYLGLGRGAAVAAILFWIIVEREIRRRQRAGQVDARDELLPYRILLALLALTGPLVPGGGTPYAISWAAAWLIAAYFERRLRLDALATADAARVEETPYR